MNRKKRIVSIVLLTAGLFCIPLIIEDYFVLGVLITCCLNIILALSMGLQYYAGMFGLAHMAFVGIGAYTSAVLSVYLDLSVWLCLLLGAVSATIWGMLFGLLVLRLRRMYFFLSSFCIAGIIEKIFSHFWEEVLGGYSGIRGIPKPEAIGVWSLRIDFSGYDDYYYIALSLMLLSVAYLYKLNKSKFGLTFNAIRLSPDIAEHVGVNVFQHKILAFATGCFFAGIAGGFYAHFHRIIEPTDFGIWQCVYIQIFVILGGMYYFWGPFIGAILMTFLVQGVLSRYGFYEHLAYGGILVLGMLFLPDGLMSVLPKIGRLKKKG